MPLATDLAFFTEVNAISADGLYRDTVAAALKEGGVGPAELLTIRDLAAGAPTGARLALLLLLRETGRGSSCLSLQSENLKDLCASLPGANPDRVAAEIIKWEAAGFRDGSDAPTRAGAELVTRIDRAAASSLPASPLVAVGAKGEDTLLYCQRYYHYEQRLEHALQARLDAPARQLAEGDRHAQVFREVLPDFMADNLHQQVAVGLALMAPFMVLSGGPGTGKTTTVVTILRALLRLGSAADQILLAAPTGRAAHRMGDAIRLTLDRLAETADLSDQDKGLADLKPLTLHRALVYRPSRHDFKYSAQHPLPYSVAIIDEVSMVDLTLMTRLLEALPQGARLILVGDRNQLPAVDVGAVLAELVPRDIHPAFSPQTLCGLRQMGINTDALAQAESGSPYVDHIVVLTESKRGTGTIRDFAEQEEAGELQRLLEDAPTIEPELRAADDDEPTTIAGKTAAIDWPEQEGSLVRIQPPGKREQQMIHWKLVVEAWARNHFLNRRAKRGEGSREWSYPALVRSICDRHRGEFDDADAQGELKAMLGYLKTSRILCLVRRGPFGSETVNRQLIALLREPVAGLKGADIFTGMPVIVTANDYTLELFNGDEGLAVRPRNDTWHLAVIRRDTVVLYALELIKAWEPAFALTVHKSQGSEYDRVLLAVPPEDAPGASRLLTREILYTGVTRAKTMAVIYSDKAALLRMIGRRIRRGSGVRLGRD